MSDKYLSDDLEPENNNEQIEKQVKNKIKLKKKHIIISSIILVILVFLFTPLKSIITNGLFRSGLNISVPQEWINEFYLYDYPDNRAYDFFSTTIYNLTHQPLIRYNLNELPPNSLITDDVRKRYLFNESNIDSLYPSPSDLKIRIKSEELTDKFNFYYSKQISDMKEYGIQTYTKLEEQLPVISNSSLNLKFQSPAHLNTDFDALLNIFFPLDNKNGPFNIVKKNNKKTVVLDYSDKTNQDYNSKRIVFRKTRTNPRKDVIDNIADIGIFAKYRHVENPKTITEVELPLGTVFYVWSPNIKSDELAWIYNNYIEKARDTYQSQNKFLKSNSSWVPDLWHGLEKGHKAQLEEAIKFRRNVSFNLGKNQKYLVYFDRNELEDFAKCLEKINDQHCTFKIERSISSDFLCDNIVKEKSDNNGTKILYIYGIDQHSFFGYPAQIITKSFWFKKKKFKNSPNYLKPRVDMLVSTFSSKVVLTGEIDPAEYKQYGDLEKSLTIGGTNSIGGMYPLFTVPYSIVYHHNKFKQIEFNSTRGFTKIILKK